MLTDMTERFSGCFSFSELTKVVVLVLYCQILNLLSPLKSLVNIVFQ